MERFSKIQFIDERNVGRDWNFRDITELKRAEEEVEATGQWYQVHALKYVTHHVLQFARLIFFPLTPE